MGPIYDLGLAVDGLIWCFCVSTPLWLPIAFAGYCIGRKQFGIKTLLVLTAAMAFATDAISEHH